MTPTCCTPRPAGARAYTCRCGQRWRLTQDGWVKCKPDGRMPPLRGAADPLREDFADDYDAGLSIERIARKYRLHTTRVSRALHAQPDFVLRPHGLQIRMSMGLPPERVVEVEFPRMDGSEPARVQRAEQVAGSISHSIHILRAHARLEGVLPADEGRVAAAHAAGLTLHDIESVFAIPPAEAVAMIAAGHGGR